MIAILNSLAVLCICTVATVGAKQLHTKERDTEIDGYLQKDGVVFDDLNANAVQKRFARHMELVTESVLDHLFNEINSRYTKTKNETNFPKMLRRLKMKLKSMNRKRKTKKKHIHKANSTLNTSIEMHRNEIF